MTEELATIETTDTLATGNNVNAFADGIMRKVSEQGYFATFDTEAMSGRKKLYKATNAASLLRDFMNTPIQAVGFVFSPTTVTTETGETDTVVGGYIIDKDGNAYVSSSGGVCKSILQIISQFGDPETWDEPLTVVCKETNTAKGRRYKFLDVE